MNRTRLRPVKGRSGRRSSGELPRVAKLAEKDLNRRKAARSGIRGENTALAARNRAAQETNSSALSAICSRIPIGSLQRATLCSPKNLDFLNRNKDLSDEVNLKIADNRRYRENAKIAGQNEEPVKNGRLSREQELLRKINSDLYAGATELERRIVRWPQRIATLRTNQQTCSRQQ